MGNAHASKTPHLVGQLAKARREIGALLEQWGSPHADTRAGQLLDVLQDLGWTPRRDLTETPPPPPDKAKPTGPGYAAFLEAKAELAARRETVDSPSTDRGRGTH